MWSQNRSSFCTRFPNDSRFFFNKGGSSQSFRNTSFLNTSDANETQQTSNAIPGRDSASRELAPRLDGTNFPPNLLLLLVKVNSYMRVGGLFEGKQVPQVGAGPSGVCPPQPAIAVLRV